MRAVRFPIVILTALVALLFMLPKPVLGATVGITTATITCTSATVNIIGTSTGPYTYQINVRNAVTNALLETAAGGGAAAGAFVASHTLPINPIQVTGTLLYVEVTATDGVVATDTSAIVACTGGIAPPVVGGGGTGVSPIVESPVLLPTIDDGRINPGKGDVKVVIYPLDGGGFQVYRIDSESKGWLAISVTGDELAQYPQNPESNILIATSNDGLVSLYKLVGGEYQVNSGPDANGKITTIVFGGGSVYTIE